MSDVMELRVQLQERPTSSQALALRCRIVLACAEGLSNVQAATRLSMHHTLGNSYLATGSAQMLAWSGSRLDADLEGGLPDGNR